MGTPLHVAVDDAMGVGMVERVAELDCHRSGPPGADGFRRLGRGGSGQGCWSAGCEPRSASTRRARAALSLAWRRSASARRAATIGLGVGAAPSGLGQRVRLAVRLAALAAVVGEVEPRSRSAAIRPGDRAASRPTSSSPTVASTRTGGGARAGWLWAPVSPRRRAADRRTARRTRLASGACHPARRAAPPRSS
jgi:hypothetical protein